MNNYKMEKSNRKMKLIRARSALITLIAIIFLTILLSSSRVSSYSNTFLVDAYKYEYIIFTTGDQTVNIKLTAEPIFGYYPVTIFIFDKKNFNNWKNDLSYSFINATHNPDGEYYLRLNENSRYYLVIDNSDSFFDSKITISLSSYGFYGGEIYVRENELTNLLFLLFALLFIPLTYLAVRISKKKKVESPVDEQATIIHPSESPPGTTKFCTKCFFEIETHEKICPNCGKRF